MAKSNPVSFNRDARAEATAAARWYAARNRTAGPAFRAALTDLLDLLARFPAAGGLLDDGVHRAAMVGGFPYLVVYRETARGGIRVVAVAHTSRAPGYWHGRA